MSVKMYTFIVVIIALFALSSADVNNNDISMNDGSDFYMLQGVKVYPSDRQCALVGGLCVHSSDCNEPTTNKGLCPSKTHMGVECCYELPVRPAPCSQHLGECKETCHKALLRPGNDCGDGQVCCVLIH